MGILCLSMLVCGDSFAKVLKDDDLPASGVAVEFDDGTEYGKNYDSSDTEFEIQSDAVMTDNNAVNTVIIYGAASDGNAVAQMLVGPFSQGIEVSSRYNHDMSAAEEKKAQLDPENFSNLVIAQVNNYVNVRDIPSEDGEVVGKLYDDSVGHYIEESDGWYLIESGSVRGYVKKDFCVTGEDAINLAKTVGTKMAKVNTTTLKVRGEASVDSEVLGLVPIDDDLLVVEELDDWVKVSIEEGEGYVSKEYVELRTDFVEAESKAEEEARLEKERQAQREAQEVAQRAREENITASQTTNNNNNNYKPPSYSESSMGKSVADYACQFVGNPYVYGGSSLTNGTDCSGFVMSVYKAFGVSLPHSSTADRSQGYAVEGGMANAQPGDILCYSGHVAIYIGNGQIVHASTSRTGIIISNANYRSVLAVRRIF